jgi:hypothetical protein
LDDEKVKRQKNRGISRRCQWSRSEWKDSGGAGERKSLLALRLSPEKETDEVARKSGKN